jgi:hypothetical protein
MPSRTPRLTAKTSTIYIATADETHIYRSVGEVPPSLRRRLEETTTGSNSATILIADKRGRAELVRALQGLPSDVQSRLARTIQTRRAKAEAERIPEPPKPHQRVRFWAELLLPFGVGVALWLLLSWRA